jgi:hypothetical protein
MRLPREGPLWKAIWTPAQLRLRFAIGKGLTASSCPAVKQNSCPALAEEYFPFCFS